VRCATDVSRPRSGTIPLRSSSSRKACGSKGVAKEKLVDNPHIALFPDVTDEKGTRVADQDGGYVKAFTRKTARISNADAACRCGRRD
jgi:hypothetical protein